MRTSVALGRRKEAYLQESSLSGTQERGVSAGKLFVWDAGKRRICRKALCLGRRKDAYLQESSLSGTQEIRVSAGKLFVWDAGKTRICRKALSTRALEVLRMGRICIRFDTMA
jgi:predicted kinase